MVKSQVIVGISFMVVGFAFSLTLIGAIYGIPIFIIGLFLIIYRNAEGEIEKIKVVNEKGDVLSERPKLYNKGVKK